MVVILVALHFAPVAGPVVLVAPAFILVSRRPHFLFLRCAAVCSRCGSRCSRCSIVYSRIASPPFFILVALQFALVTGPVALVAPVFILVSRRTRSLFSLRSSLLSLRVPFAPLLQRLFSYRGDPIFLFSLRSSLLWYGSGCSRCYSVKAVTKSLLVIKFLSTVPCTEQYHMIYCC